MLKRLRRTLPLVMVAAALPLLAAGQEAAEPEAPAHPVFPTAPTVERLPNGLTVVSVPWDSPGIIAYYTLVRVGSRDEVEAGHSGFAHLFEHMMFRGTERFPQEAYEARIQGFGADNNAYTTRDFTMYTITGPSAALPQLVELEADRFQRLHYSEEQFRTETGAVQGEYAKSASNPFLQMWEGLSEMAFTRHTYGHTTLGYLRDICAMPDKFEYSQRFFERFYTPDNATIVVAGDIDHARLMELVREHYGAWEGTRDEPRILREPNPRGGQTRHIPWDGSSPPRIFLGYRIPQFESSSRRIRDRRESMRDTAALQIVHGLVFSESSPLYQRLVVDEQKAIRLYSWDGDYNRDPGLFIAGAVLKPDVPFEPIIEAIQSELTGVARGHITDERIEAVRSNLRYSLLTGIETPDQAANLVGSFVAAGGDVGALERYLAALAAVDGEDIQRVAQRYLTERRRYVVTLAPRGEDEGEAQTSDELCPSPETEGDDS